MIGAILPAIVAFNLVCSGMMRTGPVGLVLPEEGGEPFTVTYRIDLDSRRWCSDACAETESLDSVFEGEIVLRDRHEPDWSQVVTISPAVGRFSDTLIEGNTATLRSGTCQAEAFAGFPLSVA